MRKNFFTACFIAIAMIFFVQCSKSDSSPTPAAVNFSPVTTGSSWTYKFTEGASAANTFKLTVTGRDTTVASGRTYKVLSNSDGSTSYIGKSGNDYYRFASFPTIGIDNFEELYLKDNKAVNESWTGSTNFKYQGQNITANLAYTIKGKGETRTVNGKTFNNVTRVRLDISVILGSIGGGDFYYQEGVGLIEDNISVTPPFAPPYSSREEIVSYDIK